MERIVPSPYSTFLGHILGRGLLPHRVAVLHPRQRVRVSDKTPQSRPPEVCESASPDSIRPCNNRLIALQLRDIAEALAYLHRVNVIHGDIKSQNALVASGQEPFILLCDFGLSRDEFTMLTTSKGLRGTPVFQAPEIWLEEIPRSKAADVWAFAILITEVRAQPFMGLEAYNNLVARFSAVKYRSRTKTCARSCWK